MLLATSLKRSCLAKKTIIVKNVTVNIEPLMRMRKAVFKNGRAKIVYVMNGWNRFKASRDFMEWFEGLAGGQTGGTLSSVFRSGGSRRQVRGRVRPTRQGCKGDSRSGGHGARGCGVPEGITAGQRRVAYGQMRLDDV